MTPLKTPLPSRAFATPHAGDEYFTTEAHYLSLAGRLVAALRRGSSFVLVIGDPPPNPLLLSRALGTAAAWWYAVIVAYGPELSRDQLLRVPPRPAASGGGRWAVQAVESASPLSPLFIFDDADRLSDEQIENVYQSLTHSDGITPAGVLLAHPAFLDRLEQSKPRLIKERTACFRFHELGREEIETFIRRQECPPEQVSAFTRETITFIADISGGDPALVNHLARLMLEFTGSAGGRGEDKGIIGIDGAKAPADTGERALAVEAAAERFPSTPQPRRRPARGLQIGLLLCLALGGTLAVPPDSVWSLVQRAKPTLAAFPSIEFTDWIKLGRHNASPATADNTPQAADVTASPVVAQQPPPPQSGTALLAAVPQRPAGETADVSAQSAGTPPTAPAATAAPPEPQPTSATPGATSNRLRLSAAEISALVARGDAFVGARDLASARLLYERAVEAGDGRAALRMGATFDPAFLDRSGIRSASSDQQEALLWYRRARDLGQAEAERRLKDFKQQ